MEGESVFNEDEAMEEIQGNNRDLRQEKETRGQQQQLEKSGNMFLYVSLGICLTCSPFWEKNIVNSISPQLCCCTGLP